MITNPRWATSLAGHSRSNRPGDAPRCPHTPFSPSPVENIGGTLGGCTGLSAILTAPLLPTVLILFTAFNTIELHQAASKSLETGAAE
jgi:hypothetical protein